MPALMLWFAVALVSLALNGALLYGCWNLYEKHLVLESWYEEVAQDAEDGYRRLQMLDENGAFEADDEVGMLFEILKKTYTKFYDRANFEG